MWLSLQYEHRVILQGINRWWGFPVSSRYGRGVWGLDAANACEQFSPGITYDYLTYVIGCLVYCSNYPGYDGKATETYCLRIRRKNPITLAKEQIVKCLSATQIQGILQAVVCLILVYHITKTRPPDIPCSGDPQFPNSEQESPSQPTLTHRKTPERPEIYNCAGRISLGATRYT